MFSVRLDCHSVFLSVPVLPSTLGVSSKPVLQKDFLHALVHSPVVNHYYLLLNAYSSGREWGVVSVVTTQPILGKIYILGYWR